MAERTGGRVLIDALRINGIDMAFGVPGESYLAALDALYDVRAALRFVVCRQEGGAAFMAEAYGKLTGRPGVCFATRGPGACNASIGVHTAFQDSTPMLLLLGQVERSAREREAFQEVEFRQMFAPLAKWVAEVDSPQRIPEMVNRAVSTCLSGRPGPVVLTFPEDVLSERCTVADLRPTQPAAAAPDDAALQRLRDLLAGAERPLLIVGGGGWTAQAGADVLRFAAASGLPVATSFRCQDYVDNRHDHYVGDVGIAIDPALARRVRDADLIIALGPRLGEITTQGYTLLDLPVPRQRLVHIHPGAEELNRVYQPDLAIVAALPQAARALAALEPVDGGRWAGWRAAGRADYEASLTPRPQPGGVDMGQVMTWLRDRLPDDTILCNGAGNYTGWIHRCYRFRRFRTQLAPTAGAMGYGVPAAVAAKLVQPERVVVAFAGDGCFQMTGQELATAVQYRLPIVVLVINNGMFGTIRMHQERAHPGRVIASDLTNPDFARLAEAHGAAGRVVEETAAFPEAFEEALRADRPTLLELRVSPESLTTTRTLSDIRAAALTPAAR